MVELIFWIFLGCLLGTITGLSPGIHVNTISFLVLLISTTSHTGFALMIVAMAVVHSFVDFIPSILLGAPDNDSFLSVLPGHYFLLKGKALTAVKLTIVGGIFSTIFSILFLPFFMLFVLKLNEFFKLVIPWILSLSLALMVLTEKQKAFAVSIIVFSAALGLIGLKSSLIQNPLFPLITGFFGASTIVFSVQKNEGFAKQKEEPFKVGIQKVLMGTIFSSIAGAIVSIIPSLGASQAAFLLKQFVGKISKAQYLIILGGINTANFLFSFFFLFLTAKTRTGAAVAVKELIEINETSLILVVFTIIISAGIGAILTEILAKKAIKKLQKINYKLLSKTVFAFLLLLSFVFSGLFGLIAFITATAVGLAALSTGVKRTTCMAFLMVPTILFYFQGGL